MVLDHDQVVKLKITNFFLPGVFVSDSRKFMLAKISCYTVYILEVIYMLDEAGDEIVSASFMHIQKCLTIIYTYAQKARNPLRVIHPSTLVSTVRLMSWSSQG